MSLIDTAIILAGGKSTRMGFDKQLINVEGFSNTDYSVKTLRPLLKNIIVVTNKPGLYKDKDIIITKDCYKGYGPLGGIHAGLLESKSLYNYFIACDMPYINAGYIKYMMKKIYENNFITDAVITKFEDWIEPFNAFYSRRLIPVIEESMINGNKKIGKFLEKSNVLYIEEKVARGFSPDWGMFINLNTEKDLENIESKLNRRIII
ncbi:MAG: molybdenum cofactor guanylyltransferase [Clostridiales bacterium]|nr:molybdenum cofactor guanylyltransferase [Clostridiales bacterium]